MIDNIKPPSRTENKCFEMKIMQVQLGITLYSKRYRSYQGDSFINETTVVNDKKLKLVIMNWWIVQSKKRKEKNVKETLIEDYN